MIHSINVETTKRNQMVDITKDIIKLVRDSRVSEGYVLVFVPHTTAAITINEGADPDVASDIVRTLQNMIPEHDSYKHVEGNSDAHIKASFFGSSEILLVENNQLVLGTWQHIFFYEGDGPRNRKVFVKIIPTDEKKR